MNTNVQHTIDTSLKRLSDALAAGRSETLTDYLKAMARFYDYSWFNVMMIFTQRPGATRVAGFNTWKKLGRWVMRGQKGIVILAPLLKKDDDGKNEIYGFKAVRVYDYSQTEGRKMPEFDSVHGDPGRFTQSLATLASDQGIEVEYVDSLNGADGVSTGGKVKVCRDLPEGEQFAVLTHEIAHELMHRGERKASKRTKELEAEAVAFVVCSVLGLDTYSRSRDYIQLYQGDDKALGDSLQHIQQTVKFMLSAVI